MEFVINTENNEMYLIISNAVTPTGKTICVLRNIVKIEQPLLVEPEQILNTEKYIKVTPEKLARVIKNLKE